jgi:hypothetical protein
MLLSHFIEQLIFFRDHGPGGAGDGRGGRGGNGLGLLVERP